MFKKMKKKIGFAFRVYGYQVAMSIYTMMISMPLIALTDNIFVRSIAVLFSIGLFLVMVYFAAHGLGEKDFVGRNNPIDPPKPLDGFVFGIMSQLINYLALILMLIPAGGINNVATAFMNLFGYMFMHANFIKGGLKAVLGEGSTSLYPLSALWYFVFTLPTVISCGIGYMFGYKGIKISEKLKLDKKEIHSGPNDDNPNFDK